MSTEQDDMFAPPAEPDLRSPQSWRVTLGLGDDRYGWWVRTSWCGRFKVCGNPPSARVVLFRSNVVNDRWNPPDVIGGYLTLQEAFDAAAKLVEEAAA